VPTPSVDRFDAARFGLFAHEELTATARELQPGALVDDRPGIPGDRVTPERYQPDRPLERPGVAVRRERTDPCGRIDCSTLEHAGVPPIASAIDRR
jgi:hypothetical protein